MSVLLDVKKISKTFVDTTLRMGPRRAPVRAVDGVSFQVHRGETLAVVGESGCGKSTLGRLLLHLIEMSEGSVIFDGQDMSALSKEDLRRMRQHMQMVFQDPFGSLSPRRTVADIIAEPMDSFGLSGSRKERREKVARLLEMVGLPASYMDRKPRQFSGGQRQRIGIARAISVDPSFIVADEPVSALDVSIQAQIINLMQDLQRQKGFSFLFIAHDLAVVRHVADRVAVMYLGRIIELGTKDQIYSAPHHPYTEALLSAAPRIDLKAKSNRIILQGDVPSPSNVPSGCAFRTRCPIATDRCAQERPELSQVEPGRAIACHYPQPFPISNQRTGA
ncbi:MAG: dipeptide ABC transporter ATP-binding protein [Pseudotabrizicola sp.]|uniref:ABC transporter ATP-binding protein n=1 Tax=Pseudotabrizicola sp. TaxID=2939647 RepID=UPI00273074ED|nr:dipeptide ABC transporter ATP-binding protein [Pseudotabrizicola sp.]MDP2081306.1 dipeptide ABC transporter ATP-binding protein [Pseudotabrizicola sp.]MDZ7576075.1 dipeptide ABC transporter ATP-binding protein [Pseudotabrizicola sp.]